MAPEGYVDAVEYARRTLGRTLRAAREAAALTRGELAKRVGRPADVVGRAEAGSVRVGERYIASVLKACGLPKDWKAPTA